MDLIHDSNADCEEALTAHPVAATQPTGVVSSLDRFLARAAERRAEQEADPKKVSGPWVDPNPDAIAELPAKRHPVAVFMSELAQSRAGIAKRKATLRHIVAELTDRPRTEVTWKDVMTYPWHHVSADMAEDFYLSIRAQYSNGHTRKMYITYLRSVIRRCQRAKLMSLSAVAEVFEHLPVSSVRSRAQHARRLLPEEVNAIMDSCQVGSEFVSARDAAMIALFATTGMRVSEITKLELTDWDQSSQVLTLRQTKNGRDRLVPVDERVTEYLKAWLTVRGDEPGPLFTRLEGRTGPQPNLSTESVRERLRILTERADIGTVHTHDFRRTVATTLLRTHDAALLAQLLGHSSLAATMTYDLSGLNEQRHAVSTLPLPLLEEEPAGGEEDAK